MNVVQRPSRPYLWVFVATFLLALIFAVYTQHAWEDYYITFRASKNLATGHGLVFNHGDRLQTFTSPLGVLLPALTSILTLNRSDAAALWLFRLICIAAFAGATTILYACVHRLYRSAVPAALAASCLALDVKSIDFTINGMETGILLFFIALTLWAQFGNCTRRWLWLGVAWGGLMWTRPDGFVYIGLLAAGGWLFNDAAHTGLNRREWLKNLVAAAGLCTALYLPWFAGSWWYYGSPVPHTVLAKGLQNVGAKPLFGALELLVRLPFSIWNHDSSVPGTFLPSYYWFGGWPAGLVWIAKGLGFLVAFAWLIPVVRGPVRAASFAFCGLHVYLSYYPNLVYPWYLPGTAIVACFVIAGVSGQLFSAGRIVDAVPLSIRGYTARTLATILAAAVLALNLWTTPAVARQLSQQQRWIENGNRRQIGLWLREHARPSDTVFLEPLGYIAYYSRLKTYDIPGLSSREVTQVIKQAGLDWGKVVDTLKPDWLVLRPSELPKIPASILAAQYDVAHTFDVSSEIQQLAVHGYPYLNHDAVFLVFARNELPRVACELGAAYSREPVGVYHNLGGRRMYLIHAPSRLVVPVPVGSHHVAVAYGFPSGAYTGESKTDGATFVATWKNGTQLREIHRQRLSPVDHVDERGIHVFDGDLPSSSTPAELILTAEPGATRTNDWTCWSAPDFK